MKNILFFCILFCLTTTSYSQLDGSEFENINQILIDSYLDGHYREGCNLFLKYKQKKLALFGEQSTEYADFLNIGGILFQNIGNFEKAKEYAIKYIEIYEKYHPSLHRDIGIGIFNLGLVYLYFGKLPTAQEHLLKAEKYQKKHLGSDNPEYLNTLFYLGDICMSLGDFVKAEEYMLKPYEFYAKPENKKLRDAINVLNGLARLYTTTGFYIKAEPIYLELKDISEKQFGYYHPSHGTILNNIADFYSKIWHLEKTEKYFYESMEIRDSVLEKHNPSRGEIRNSLGSFFNNTKQFDKAIQYCSEALDIYNRAKNIDSIDYIYVYGNLILAYTNKKKFEDASTHRKLAVQLLDKVLFTNHPHYADLLNIFAIFENYKGNYKKEHALLQQVCEVKKQSLGKNHQEYYVAMSKLAMSSFYLKDTLVADSLFRISEEIYTKLLKNYYPTLSEIERLGFLNSLQKAESRFLSFVSSLNDNYSNSLKLAFERGLNTKGLILSTSLDFRLNNFIRNNTEAKKDYYNWKNAKSRIRQSYLSSAKKRQKQNINLDSLIEVSDQLEKKLTRLVFANGKEKRTIMFNELKQALKPEEIAIDIVRFVYQKENTITDSILYYAFLVKTNWEYPKMIYLGEERMIEKYFSNSATATKSQETYYNSTSNAYELHQQIWKPLTPYLKDIKTIHLSPSGLFHKLSFASLATDKKGRKLLFDKYKFTYHNVLRNFVLSQEREIKKRKEILLIGASNFDFPVKEIPDVLAQLEKHDYSWSHQNAPFPTLRKIDGRRNIPSDSLRFGNTFTYLAGTKKEIDKIAMRFVKKKWEVRKFVGNEALEDVLNAFEGSNSPAILHIPTHGFFYSFHESNSLTGNDSFRKRLTYAKDPSVRSGLAFTGANAVWSKNEEPEEGIQDGILTALEISNLDLSNTELVVLSACDTGLGDFQNGEGVFGLQRAFKLAGVSKIIISLWKVDDSITAELMDNFYKHYLKGKSIRSAFNKAQKKMRKKYPPYYWAGFILME